MRKTIQIGNLGFSIDDHDLARLFAPYGAVWSAKVSTHFDTGKSTGVGFVDMESDEGESAIAALHGRSHCGRILSVCWSDGGSGQDAERHEMFGPMNVTEVSAPQEMPERRGLP